MILVTVGTTPFDRLIQAMDETTFSQDVQLQIATGSYVPKNKPYFRFSDEMHKHYQEASIVVTHGGAGTLFELLHMKKKIIAVTNTERTDQHQIDLLTELSNQNVIQWCSSINDLQQMVESASITTTYNSQPCSIPQKLIEILSL